MKMSSIAAQLAISFATILLISTTVFIVSYSSLQSLKEQDDWNSHTYEVLDSSAKLISAIIDQETGVRGFLVSGDKQFLEPFYIGKQVYQDQLQYLLNKTSDNAAQQKRLKALGELENQWRTEIAEREISLVLDEKALEQAREIEASGAGKKSMDALRQVHAEFEIAERKLLKLRSDAKEGTMLFSAIFTVIGGIGVVTLSLLFGWFLFRRISIPISRMTSNMKELSEGNFSISIDGAERGDEIGEMANALEVFRQAAERESALMGEEKQRLQKDLEKTRKLENFQEEISEIVAFVSAGELEKRLNTENVDDDLIPIANKINDMLSIISQGIDNTSKVLAALSDMDLTKRVEGEFEGAFLNLKNDTNAVATKLNDVVTQLIYSAEAISGATSDLLDGSNDLSSRTARQAGTIEETSASMVQLAATVNENSKEAKEAATCAQQVQSSAEEGRLVMQEATSAMSKITDGSAKISNIIGMIDDIAFQTNLLALNASVEAARAGEAGKGFSVVAVEVRRLAQSAAEASNDVKSLIEKSSSEVRSGEDLVSKASEMLETIFNSSVENLALMNSIAEKSSSQAEAIDQINTAVADLDKSTQNNASLVEQTNQAIGGAEKQTNELEDLIKMFKADTDMKYSLDEVPKFNASAA